MHGNGKRRPMLLRVDGTAAEIHAAGHPCGGDGASHLRLEILTVVLLLLQKQLSRGAEGLSSWLVLLHHRARPTESTRELVDLFDVTGHPNEPISKRLLIA